MTSTTTLAAPIDEVKMRRVARLLACDMHELPEILKMEGISQQDMGMLVASNEFAEILRQEQSAWASTDNADERITIKSKALVEEFLVEAYARLHDQKESLLHKTALLKEIARFGRIASQVDNSQVDRVQVIINLPSAPAVAVTLPVTKAIETEYEEVEE